MKKRAAFLLLPLSACVNFTPKPPPTLLALDSAVAPSAGQSWSSQPGTVLTLTPLTVPQELAGNRVPVRTGETAIAYVKGAQWVEMPSRLFARLLADTLAVRTGRLVLTRTLSSGPQLSGELRRFGVDADSKEAVVVFDAMLTRGDKAELEKRRFEARVPLAVIDAHSVGPALNTAANQVAVQVADWVGR